MSEQPVGSRSSNARLVVLAALLLGGVAGWVILFSLFNRPSASPNSGDGAAIIEGVPFSGIEPIEPPRPVRDFALTDQNNRTTRLSDFRGRYVLLFFGFTHCPDVCPLTLLEFKKVRLTLDQRADELAVIFVSVDPKRDTPDVIGRFLARFDTSFVGLSGPVETLAEIAPDYDLYFAIGEEAANNQTDDYLVQHTSDSFLLNREGELVASYVYGTDGRTLGADILRRLGPE